MTAMDEPPDGREICMCGDYMEGHPSPMLCGHTPVSMHDYYWQNEFQQEDKSMNYSTAVFLISNKARGILATYEATENAPGTFFKTFDKSIQKDDFVVVETDTRHKMTVCKVVEVDVEPDFDSTTPIKWVLGRVDLADANHLREQEADAITAIKAAEKRKKREELAKTLEANMGADLKSLPSFDDGAVAVERPPHPQDAI